MRDTKISDSITFPEIIQESWIFSKGADIKDAEDANVKDAEDADANYLWSIDRAHIKQQSPQSVQGAYIIVKIWWIKSSSKHDESSCLIVWMWLFSSTRAHKTYFMQSVFHA